MMTPLWCKASVLLFVQMAFGVNPLDTVLNVTVDRVLLGVKTRLAAQMEAFERRLDEQTTEQDTRLAEALAILKADLENSTNARLETLERTLIAQSLETRELVTKNCTNHSPQTLNLQLRHPLVFLRRMDGSVDFTRPWADYQSGFGQQNGEFWLGLDSLHTITSMNQFNLRVDLTDWSGETRWSVYDYFHVGPEAENYPLSVTGYRTTESTTMGDSMSVHDRMMFSTYDVDNDKFSGHCSRFRKGGWWYNACASSNPTGEYRQSDYYGSYDENYHDGGMFWWDAYRDGRPFKELTLTLIQVDNIP